MTNSIMCHDSETLLKWNISKVMGRHCSCDSILILLIYRIDADDFINVHSRKLILRLFAYQHEFSLSLTIPRCWATGLSQLDIRYKTDKKFQKKDKTCFLIYPKDFGDERLHSTVVLICLFLLLISCLMCCVTAHVCMY